jgi:hypothetical protein
MGMKRILTVILALIGVSLILLYVGDYLSLRYRFPGNREQFGTVAVQSLLAVPEKGGKTEYILGGVENQQCVNSLFPHFDCLPCWYVNRKKEKRINM